MDPDTFLQVPRDPSFLVLVTEAAASGNLLGGLTACGVVVRTLRGRKMRETQGSWMKSVRHFSSPVNFGENWGALDESISDVDWMLRQ